MCDLFKQAMEIPWTELGEVKHLKKVSRSEHGESFYYILELMKTGSRLITATVILAGRIP